MNQEQFDKAALNREELDMYQSELNALKRMRESGKELNIKIETSVSTIMVLPVINELAFINSYEKGLKDKIAQIEKQFKDL